MGIKELKLHNFRGIKDLQLVFNPDHNIVVLVGVNGIGKSSILDCIHFLIQYYETAFKWKYGSSGILTESDVNISANITINQIKYNFGYSWDLDWAIGEGSTPEGKDVWREKEKASRENWENIEEHVKTSLIPHCFYFLANREVIDLGSSFQAQNIIGFEIFSTWFKEAEDLENEIRISDSLDYRNPVIEAVRRAVCSLLGEGYGKLTFKRAINQMTIKKSGGEIAVDLLSDGEKSMLALVGYLSRKLAECDDKLESSGLVLIDEIELHLHPEWQRMIIPRLTKTFPNCQFIVTTHSPQVLSHVDPECIHILDYDGDNVIVKRPESSYGLDSNRILEDILGVSKRPKEIQDRMLELFRTINNNDLASAKEIVKELGDRIGINEPELVKAEATIKRREIIGR